MTLEKMRASMRRARLELLPAIPKTLKQLDLILSNPLYNKLTNTLLDDDNIYAGSCGEGRNRSIIFASKRQLRRLGRAKQVFSDGTFKPVPKGIPVSQVWNICTNRDNHVSYN